MSSLIAIIPNTQVTPRTGSSVPKDRSPAVAFLCKEDLVITLVAHRTLTNETIIRRFKNDIKQTGTINR